MDKPGQDVNTRSGDYSSRKRKHSSAEKENMCDENMELEVVQSGDGDSSETSQTLGHETSQTLGGHETDCFQEIDTHAMTNQAMQVDAKWTDADSWNIVSIDSQIDLKDIKVGNVYLEVQSDNETVETMDPEGVSMDAVLFDSQAVLNEEKLGTGENEKGSRKDNVYTYKGNETVNSDAECIDSIDIVSTSDINAERLGPVALGVESGRDTLDDYVNKCFEYLIPFIEQRVKPNRKTEIVECKYVDVYLNPKTGEMGRICVEDEPIGRVWEKEPALDSEDKKFKWICMHLIKDENDKNVVSVLYFIQMAMHLACKVRVCELSHTEFSCENGNLVFLSNKDIVKMKWDILHYTNSNIDTLANTMEDKFESNHTNKPGVLTREDVLMFKSKLLFKLQSILFVKKPSDVATVIAYYDKCILYKNRPLPITDIQLTILAMLKGNGVAALEHIYNTVPAICNDVVRKVHHTKYVVPTLENSIATQKEEQWLIDVNKREQSLVMEGRGKSPEPQSVIQQYRITEQLDIVENICEGDSIPVGSDILPQLKPETDVINPKQKTTVIIAPSEKSECSKKAVEGRRKSVEPQSVIQDYIRTGQLDIVENMCEGDSIPAGSVNLPEKNPETDVINAPSKKGKHSKKRGSSVLDYGVPIETIKTGGPTKKLKTTLTAQKYLDDNLEFKMMLQTFSHYPEIMKSIKNHYEKSILDMQGPRLHFNKFLGNIIPHGAVSGQSTSSISDVQLSNENQHLPTELSEQHANKYQQKESIDKAALVVKVFEYSDLKLDELSLPLENQKTPTANTLDEAYSFLRGFVYDLRTQIKSLNNKGHHIQCSFSPETLTHDKLMQSVVSNPTSNEGDKTQSLPPTQPNNVIATDKAAPSNRTPDSDRKLPAKTETSLPVNAFDVNEQNSAFLVPDVADTDKSESSIAYKLTTIKELYENTCKKADIQSKALKRSPQDPSKVVIDVPKGSAFIHDVSLFMKSKALFVGDSLTKPECPESVTVTGHVEQVDTKTDETQPTLIGLSDDELQSGFTDNPCVDEQQPLSDTSCSDFTEETAPYQKRNKKGEVCKTGAGSSLPVSSQELNTMRNDINTEKGGPDKKMSSVLYKADLACCDILQLLRNLKHVLERIEEICTYAESTSEPSNQIPQIKEVVSLQDPFAAEHMSISPTEVEAMRKDFKPETGVFTPTGICTWMGQRTTNDESKGRYREEITLEDGAEFETEARDDDEIDRNTDESSDTVLPIGHDSNLEYTIKYKHDQKLANLPFHNAEGMLKLAKKELAIQFNEMAVEILDSFFDQMVQENKFNSNEIEQIRDLVSYFKQEAVQDRCRQRKEHLPLCTKIRSFRFLQDSGPTILYHVIQAKKFKSKGFQFLSTKKNCSTYGFVPDPLQLCAIVWDKKGKRLLICCVCKCQFSQIHDYLMHESEAHSKPVALVCTLCMHNYKAYKTFEGHKCKSPIGPLKQDKNRKKQSRGKGRHTAAGICHGCVYIKKHEEKYDLFLASERHFFYFKCEKCSSNFKWKQTYNDHISEHILASEEVLKHKKCQKCSCVYDNINSKKHLLMVENQNGAGQRLQQPLNEGKRGRQTEASAAMSDICYACAYIRNHQEKYNKFLATNKHYFYFKCEKCSSSFKWRFAYNRHMIEHRIASEQDLIQHKCQNCSSVYAIIISKKHLMVEKQKGDDKLLCQPSNGGRHTEEAGEMRDLCYACRYIKKHQKKYDLSFESKRNCFYFQCNKCVSSSKWTWEYNRHMSGHTRACKPSLKKKRCQQCSSVYDKIHSENQLLQLEDQEDNDFETCQSLSEGDAGTETEDEAAEMPDICPACVYIDEYQEEYDSFLESKTQFFFFQCEKCSISCKRKWAYNYHISEHKLASEQVLKEKRCLKCSLLYDNISKSTFLTADKQISDDQQLFQHENEQNSDNFVKGNKHVDERNSDNFVKGNKHVDERNSDNFVKGNKHVDERNSDNFVKGNKHVDERNSDNFVNGNKGHPLKRKSSGLSMYPCIPWKSKLSLVTKEIKNNPEKKSKSLESSKVVYDLKNRVVLNYFNYSQNSEGPSEPTRQIVLSTKLSEREINVLTKDKGVIVDSDLITSRESMKSNYRNIEMEGVNFLEVDPMAGQCGGMELVKKNIGGMKHLDKCDGSITNNETVTPHEGDVKSDRGRKMMTNKIEAESTVFPKEQSKAENDQMMGITTGSSAVNPDPSSCDGSLASPDKIEKYVVNVDVPAKAGNNIRKPKHELQTSNVARRNNTHNIRSSYSANEVFLYPGKELEDPTSAALQLSGITSHQQTPQASSNSNLESKVVSDLKSKPVLQMPRSSPISNLESKNSNVTRRYNTRKQQSSCSSKEALLYSGNKSEELASTAVQLSGATGSLHMPQSSPSSNHESKNTNVAKRYNTRNIRSSYSANEVFVYSDDSSESFAISAVELSGDTGSLHMPRSSQSSNVERKNTNVTRRYNTRNIRSSYSANKVILYPGDNSEELASSAVELSGDTGSRHIPRSSPTSNGEKRRSLRGQGKGRMRKQGKELSTTEGETAVTNDKNVLLRKVKSVKTCQESPPSKDHQNLPQGAGLSTLNDAEPSSVSTTSISASSEVGSRETDNSQYDSYSAPISSRETDSQYDSYSSQKNVEDGEQDMYESELEFDNSPTVGVNERQSDVDFDGPHSASKSTVKPQDEDEDISFAKQTLMGYLLKSKSEKEMKMIVKQALQWKIDDKKVLTEGERVLVHFYIMVAAVMVSMLSY